jgi:hypothetical protein
MIRFIKTQNFIRSAIVMLFLLPMMVVAVPAYAAVAVPPSTLFAVTCSGAGSPNMSSDTAPTGAGEQCLIDTYINPFVKVLAALVGVFVVLSIIIAGIQYSSSADDPSKVSAAKSRIMNAVIALLAFLFLLAFLKWLVPGGV